MTNNFNMKRGGENSRSQLSPQEYAEKKKSEKNAVYQMIDEAAAEVVSDPEKLRTFLDTQSRMDRYSVSNALLIYKQFPNATQLKSFGDWGEDNAKISKGAKSISILEPIEYTKKDGTSGISYNVKKVFDITQTSATHPPAPTINRDPRHLVTVMLDTAPVQKELVDELPYSDMASYYDNEKQTLFVKRNVGDSVALCQSASQELGLAQLSMDSEVYSRRDMSFQAVCIGYMLCRKFGVDTKNFAVDRIPEELASKKPKEIRAELSKIRTSMNEIYSRVSDELYRQKQERSKDKGR